MSKAKKKFDSVQMTREIRDQLSAQIQGMSLEEEIAFLAATPTDNPVLARWKARLAAEQAERESGTGTRDRSTG